MRQTIKLIDILDNGYGVTSDDYQEVRYFIEKGFKYKSIIILDFNGINLTGSWFLSCLIRYMVNKVGLNKFNKKFKIINQDEYVDYIFEQGIRMLKVQQKHPNRYRQLMRNISEI